MVRNEGGSDLQSSKIHRSDFLDYLRVVLKWRKFIMINLGAVTALAIIISLILPKWYKSTVSILPPKEQNALNPFGAASSMLRGLTSASSLGGFGQTLGAYNYLAILKSRSAMESVVDKFDLITVYDIGDSSIEKALEELESNVAFEIEEDEYITIEVYDKDPQRAADIANYFVDLLNKISIELGTQEARNNREFIGKRLENIKVDLRNAEDSLRRYQERTQMIVSPDPNSSGIASVAELYGMKARKDIELGVLRKSTTKENALVQQLEIELNEISKKLNSFPEIGIESLRLYRDVAIHQKILEFLVPLHEQAKIDEQKDVPVILVLDKAVPAERKDKPKRSLIVALAAVGALVLSLLFVFSYDFALRSGALADIKALLLQSSAKIRRAS